LFFSKTSSDRQIELIPNIIDNNLTNSSIDLTILDDHPLIHSLYEEYAVNSNDYYSGYKEFMIKTLSIVSDIDKKTNLNEEVICKVLENAYKEYDKLQTTMIQSMLNDYYNRSYHDQKSDDWLKIRTNYITASAVANAIGVKGEAAKNQLLVEKITLGKSTKFTGNLATHWGERYEPVANSLYIYRNNKQCMIHEYGLIPHKTIDFLGVSTDGVIEYTSNISTIKNKNQLLNLEIKCPMSRKIDGLVPVQYYHQIQLQLEVLNLKLSEFLECEFTEYSNVDEFINDKTDIERGIIIEVMKYNEHLSDYKQEYLYCDLDYHNIPKLLDWKNKKLNEINQSEDMIYTNIFYWKLVIYSCVLVSKNENWLTNYLPKLKEFWTTVLEQRTNPDFNENEFLKKKKKEFISTNDSIVSEARLCLLD
jgi:putative phage-type endonuclease